MRVISGKFKKKKLLLPNAETTRPLRDYVKESIFNLLTHSKLLNFQFNKSNILDIFSGSGSFGIECISRGAPKVVFLEKEKKVLDILIKNINNIYIKEQCEVISGDILKINFNNLITSNLNLIFLDPPFKYKFFYDLFVKFAHYKNKLDSSLFIIHHEDINNFEFKSFFNIILKKKYGKSVILFAKLKI